MTCVGRAIAENPAGSVVETRPGQWVEASRGGWVTRYRTRGYFWYGRSLALLEVFDAEDRLVELYVHVVSGVRRDEAGIHYTDHELDVVQPAGQAAFVDDEDEFAEAVARYGYTPDFQAACRAACAAAAALIADWPVGAAPEVGLARAPER
jgi:predicted RNA-binding protein associated with RNAse of E/G family